MTPAADNESRIIAREDDRMITRRLCGAIAVAGLLALSALALSAGASAQTYPNRPIRLIVPFPAGGPPDVLARVVADLLGPRLGQTIVVENRPGAGATIGTRSVATAEPDGYTFLYASTTSLSIAPSLFKSVGYDPVNDFAPVGGVSVGPMVVVVHPSIPAKNVKELVAHAKANPGKLNYGAGVAAPPHIAWGLFTQVTGTDILFVPYRGMAPAMTDLLSGHIQIMIDGTGPLLPHIQAGKIRALAVTGKTRSPDLPDLPTMSEEGFDYVLSFWTGIVAPAKTPNDIIAKVNEAINDSLKAPAMKAHLAKSNVEALTSTPPEFAAFIAAEAKKWGGIVTSTGIKAE
jgi:tripartite-type tricarboxylate transporter receptor subunit TctC